MIPILYPASAASWTDNGLGFLRDCISCKVTEERNGIYEMEMQYPLSGAHYDELTEDCLIKAKASDASVLQLFRVQKTSKPINGVVTFYAKHLSYDLNGYALPGLMVSNSTADAALGQALALSIVPHHFEAWSNITTTSSTNITRPCSVRAAMGGQQGSILQFWGGEYEFDNYTVRLWEARGQQTEVVIAYGKNLVDAKQEKNLENTYTHVMPYAVQTAAAGGVETVYYLSGENSDRLIALESAALGHVKVLPLDMSEKFSEGAAITSEALREKAEAWIRANEPGKPKVNVTVAFVPLAQTENYKAIAPLQQLRLCDVVTVRFLKLGIDATAKVIKTVYDTLAERYISVEIGDAKSDFASTIVKQQQEIENIGDDVQKGFSKTQAIINQALQDQTDLITGHKGGYFVIDPAVQPYRTLWMDTDDIATAQNVLQINGGGIGFSKTGVNGPYTSAWTLDGKFNADFITAGTLTANVIRAGLLQDALGENSWNLDSGEFKTGNIEVTGGSISIGTTYKTVIDNAGLRFARSSGEDVGGIHATDGGGNLTFLEVSTGAAFQVKAGGSIQAIFGTDSASIQHDTGIVGDLTVSGSIAGNIDASQINSGVLSAERIPGLPASIINSGQFSANIISNPPWMTSVPSSLSITSLTVDNTITAPGISSTTGTGRLNGGNYAALATGGTDRLYVSSSAVVTNVPIYVNGYSAITVNATPNFVLGYATPGNTDIYAGNNLRFFPGGNNGGYVDGSGYHAPSSVELKKDINAPPSCLKMVEGATLYQYKYSAPKSIPALEPQGDFEEDFPPVIKEPTYPQSESPERLGFVIGDGYESPPDLVLGEDGKSINLYSMTAMCWKALQELAAEVAAMRGVE
jgi:phage minor structural protein